MKNLSAFNSTAKTMSSREIAKLCEKNHSHVLRDIRIILNNPKMDAIENKDFSINYRTSNGQVSEILLNEELTMTLITGYNVILRNRVIKRWKELEEQVAQPRELSRLEILQLALEAEQQNIALQQQVKVLEPKAEALDAIANTDHTYTIRECAKTIGIGERKLIQLLLSKGWVYRDQSKRLQAYSHKCDQGVFINRPSSVITNRLGEENIYLQMRVTAYGLTRITGLVKKSQKAQKVAA